MGLSLAGRLQGCPVLALRIRGSHIVGFGDSSCFAFRQIELVFSLVCSMGVECNDIDEEGQGFTNCCTASYGVLAIALVA